MTREVQRGTVISAHLLLLLFVCVPAVCAQDSHPSPQPTPLTAPPPFKTILKEERAQLELYTKDASKRLKRTIEYALSHLTLAEQHTAQANYDAAAAERAAQAGLAGVAAEAGRTMLAGREETLDAFRRAGLFLLGVKPPR